MKDLKKIPRRSDSGWRCIDAVGHEFATGITLSHARDLAHAWPSKPIRIQCPATGEQFILRINRAGREIEEHDPPGLRELRLLMWSGE